MTKENIQITCSHLKKAYNQELLFDPTVIDKVPQRPENLNFDQLPTLQELNKANANMASLAAPVELGLSPMAMKTANGSKKGPTWNHP